ncbi:hypothetical protein GCM10023205_58350 [Yinghuangia aomiensis]|uniref:Uncharacterized protein n=1 Tax=Yinghuangia aomiensis TaxID=676205 RepID=A0ABP9HXB1_9ACTN
MNPAHKRPRAAADQFLDRIVRASSTAELAVLVNQRLYEAQGNHVAIDFTGGDLYYTKFVALGVDQWLRHQPRHGRLRGLLYSDDLGPGPGTLGDSGNVSGRVRLSRAHFGNDRREEIPDFAARLGVSHLLDEAPEFVATLATLHELSHVEGMTLTELFVDDFIPNLLPGDVQLNLESVGTTLLLAKTRAEDTGESYEDIASHMIGRLAARNGPGHEGFALSPQLAMLNEHNIEVLIGTYAAMNKSEAFAESKTKLYVAGWDADEATTALAALGYSYGAITVDAGPFRDRMAHLRRSLDPRTGLPTADPVARQQEIDRQRYSARNVTRAHTANIRAALPLLPGLRPTGPRMFSEPRAPGMPAPTTSPGGMPFTPAPATTATFATVGLGPVSTLNTPRRPQAPDPPRAPRSTNSRTPDSRATPRDNTTARRSQEHGY